MTHWMCNRCGYYLKSPEPPNTCPSCSQTCVFMDVTCYRPECGGERNMDPLLVGATLGTLKQPKAKQPKVEGPLANVETFTQGQIMSGLNDQQRRRLVSLGNIEYYEEGDAIFTTGAESRKLYFVEEGEVLVEIEYDKRVFIPISIVAPGQAFGWSALVPPYRLTTTGVALSKTRVTAVERDALLALMRDDPSLGVILMQNVASVIASRLLNLELELVELLRGSRSAPDFFHVQL